MADHVVDSNVLIVGSAVLDPRYPDVHLDADEIERVFAWLVAFRDDSDRKLVLDDLFKIFEEYNNKLNAQHFGLQVVHYKLEQEYLRQERVEYDEHGYAIIPDALAAIDPSDKKFVAAALNDPDSITIINAADGDWAQHKELLDAHRIVVEELVL